MIKLQSNQYHQYRKDNIIMPEAEEKVVTKKPRKKYPKTTKKGTKDFNNEQKLVIIKRAEEIGIHKTAEEYDSSWQAIAAIQREARAAGLLPPKQPRRRSKKVQAENQTQTSDTTINDTTIPVSESKTKETDTPVVSNEIETVVTEPKAASIPVKQEPIVKHASLEIENAILREKIAVLTQQLDKLRSAVSQLV